MSSMMRKLSDQLSGAKAARREKRMKAEMAKHLKHVVRPAAPAVSAVEVPATAPAEEPPKDPA